MVAKLIADFEDWRGRRSDHADRVVPLVSKCLCQFLHVVEDDLFDRSTADQPDETAIGWDAEPLADRQLELGELLIIMKGSRANRRMVSRCLAADVDHCHVASANRPDVSFREQLVRPLDELNEDGRIGKGGLLAREIRLKDSPSP